MASNRLTDDQIKICIIPQHLRWPESSAGSVWAAAHRCVDALQNFVRGVDTACGEVEEDSELSAGAITRRRSEICDQALRKLMNFQPFEIAEAALTREIDGLDRLTAPNAEQARMHQRLTKARTDLDEGISATQRLVQKRCRAFERTA